MAFDSNHPDKHPIEVGGPQGASLESRVHWLEHMVALLWDHAWWRDIPAHVRAKYEAEGFTPPIDRFYGRSDPWPL